MIISMKVSIVEPILRITKATLRSRMGDVCLSYMCFILISSPMEQHLSCTCGQTCIGS